MTELYQTECDGNRVPHPQAWPGESPMQFALPFLPAHPLLAQCRPPNGEPSSSPGLENHWEGVAWVPV